MRFGKPTVSRRWKGGDENSSCNDSMFRAPDSPILSALGTNAGSITDQRVAATGAALGGKSLSQLAVVPILQQKNRGDACDDHKRAKESCQSMRNSDERSVLAWKDERIIASEPSKTLELRHHRHPHQRKSGTNSIAIQPSSFRTDPCYRGTRAEIRNDVGSALADGFLAGARKRRPLKRTLRIAHFFREFLQAT